LRLEQTELLIYRGRLQLSQGKPAVTSGKGRVEIDGLLKESLRNRVVV
jgi:hypothetical protein